MNIPAQIFKSYDIRGLYPEEINEENIVPIVKAIYSVFQKQKNTIEQLTIAVGRDMRVSSPILFDRAVTALVEMGASVVDVGLVSTPTFYFAVFHHNYHGGIQISASHNPKEYNGIKIVRNSENGLIKIGKSTGMEDIKKLALEGTFEDRAGGTKTEQKNVLQEEVENALRMTQNPPIKKFRIVADPANAMGGLYIDALFEKIPGELVRMNFKLDGTFPAHQPDPLQKETLVELQKRVVSEQAGLGLAPDGDGDRLFFIDEKGEIVPPSIITSLVARELLVKHPRETILFDIRYILTPQKIVEENGGTSIITKVGHAYITEELHKTQGIFAGESSAHFFFRETGNAESPVPVIIMVLAVMTRGNKKLSELTEELRRSYESGEINFTVVNAADVMSKLKGKYADGELSEIDGIALSYPEWRFSVRSSNTEPLLRLNVEALTIEVMEQKRDELVAFITSVRNSI